MDLAKCYGASEVKGVSYSYRVFSLGQATNTLSSPQFSTFCAGRGIVSILAVIGAMGIFGFTNPFSIGGSPTEATLATAPDRVPFAAKPLSILDGCGADVACAIGWDFERVGTSVPRVPKDGVRPGEAALAIALEEDAVSPTGAGVRTGSLCGE